MDGISDYRDGHQVTQTSSSTYASKAKTAPAIIFPKREQAIILSVIEGLKLSDYVIKVGSIVGPKNVLSASRISNNRMCIFLSSTDIVDRMVQDHAEVTIEGERVTVRRMITPARRIVCSNVCHSIPHQIVENQIRNLGFTPVSPVSFLKASIPGDEYSHVISFRRQIYVQPDDQRELPASVVLDFNGTSHRVFLAYDQLLCFLCKTAGHIAARCPSQIPRDNPTVPDMQTSLTVEENTRDQNERSAPAKRFAPDTQSLTPQTSIDETSGDPFVRPKTPPKSHRQTKKIKKSDSVESLTPIKNYLEPARTLIEESDPPLGITLEQITHFLENSFGSKDPFSIAQEITKDVPALINTITKIYPLLESRSLKSRCTRLKKTLQKKLTGDPNDISDSDQDTDSSQSSY